MQPERPNEISGVCKSSRVKFHMKQDYVPRMIGYKYSVDMYQLEDHKEINPDAHILSMKIQSEHKDVITAMMTQHLLKIILKYGKLKRTTMCNPI